jgi:transketolase
MTTRSDAARLDELSINAVRFLAVDAVQQANSGHPGAPMGMAPMAYALWDRFLKHNPADPAWANRDRFVLSAGHASMLLYALLHLSGYELSIEDIRSFRQWGSRTAGHPEHGHTPGVEVTTGPLGQGFAHGVGMALAEQLLAQHFNRPGHEVIDHYTYGIVSDGDLMEGVSAEAASLAGTWKLGKLIYLYDSNSISIEGSTDLAFTEDVGARFAAYGWHVVGPINGLDVREVEEAIIEAHAQIERPSLIICKTVIGYGSPNKANTAGVHGEPLGAEETQRTREALGWDYEPFTVPQEALERWRGALARGAKAQDEWNRRFAAYQQAFPAEAEQLAADLSGLLPEGWESVLEGLFAPGGKALATREAGGVVMNAIATRVHSLTGGSADLAPSTKTLLREHAFGEGGPHNLHFGVREHAMGSIAGGMALHGGFIPYTATFLVFADYMRPAMRLAALMGQRVVYVFTHDSIALGEDGPTHQPVEHLMSLRAMPNLAVVRPADPTETAGAWRAALERTNGPTALVLTRQGVPLLSASPEQVGRGAYVVREASAAPRALLIGTGSEVHIALAAAEALEGEGVPTRVVSMPSWELFAAQPQAYREQVLPPSVTARVSVEAGVTLGWERYVGERGTAIGVDTFGASAPYQRLYTEFGLTPEAVAAAARALLTGGGR